jgi:hypothetical protein
MGAGAGAAHLYGTPNRGEYEVFRDTPYLTYMGKCRTMPHPQRGMPHTCRTHTPASYPHRRILCRKASLRNRSKKWASLPLTRLAYEEGRPGQPVGSDH